MPIIHSQNRTYDADLQLKAAGAVTAIGNSSSILVGNGRFLADLVLDVASLDVTTGDELYQWRYELSTDDFGSVIVSVPVFEGGDAAVTGSSADITAGTFIIPVTNYLDGTEYPYVRLRWVLNGTTPSANFEAYLSKRA